MLAGSLFLGILLVEATGDAPSLPPARPGPYPVPDVGGTPAAELMGARSKRWRVGWASVAVLAVALGGWGVKLLQVRMSVDSYAEHWAEPVGERGGLVYVALGDSAAQGIGASRPGARLRRVGSRTGCGPRPAGRCWW